MWEDFRCNYTDDVRDIFDLGSAIFAAHGDIAPARAADEEERDSARKHARSEEHTSELQSLMRISYAVFCLKKKKICQPTPSEQHIASSSYCASTILKRYSMRQQRHA